MTKIAAAIAVAVALMAAPASAHRSKRTDKCGCHHQYGVVHCHPNLKSNRCEAPVSEKAPVKKDAQKKQTKEKVKL